ncbi:MAG: 1-deoxy-D-xylulose-5-phosphate synthase [Candidatus Omnitrophica bacterium]|nr:1-deoxy-D-xylulose-5-phosphate synthase [Candidatus Omnitrophota bacterium]
MKLLDKINNPGDLKKFSIEELETLAQEIRQEVMLTVAKTGGHLASNLGAIELTVALHYVLDAPRDKIIWDVGHQAYAHKILTGRRKRFATLRQWQGLSGFPNRDESIYDTFTVGHGSTSISTALGLACAYAQHKEATDHKHRAKIVAVIGDASLGGGMALEALNHAGQLKKDLVVVLNDNKMAISKSVGALSHYLNRILTMPIYNRIKQDIENVVKRVPRLGRRLFLAAKRLEESLKSLLVPGMLFEELGFRYFGPIDGHNIEEVVRTLKSAIAFGGPVLIHAITVKGKGFPHAEEVPEKFHGVSSISVDKKVSRQKTYTQVFSEKLIRLAKYDKRIVTVTAAMPEGTGLDKFAQQFAKRFYDVGMAEGHAVGFSAGLAATGLRPVVAIYSTFLQRAYDQIIQDVCLQSLPVVFVLDRAGIVGEDGATHQGVFDLAYLRHIPNLSIMAPKDAEELEAMLEFALSFSRAIAIRYPKAKAYLQKNIAIEGYRFPKIQYAKGEMLREGEDLAIIALGSMVYPSLETAAILAKEGIECAVCNARFAKPLDEPLLKKICSRYRTVLVVEEGVGAGGFGSAVLEFAQKEQFPVAHIKTIGLPCEFISQAKRAFLLNKYGLTVKGLLETVRKELGRSSEKGNKASYQGYHKNRPRKV